MADNNDSIRSLMLPLQDDHLLVPGTVIAEVVGYAAPEAPGDDLPPWFLGSVHWRGHRVPCVALEAFDGATPGAPGARARTVVLKAVGGRRGLPYIALRTSGIPRLVNVERGAIEPLEEGDAEPIPGVSQAVLVHGEPAMIPDLEAIEAQTLRQVHA